MACNDETKEINGRSYYVVQLPPSKIIPIQLKLMKIFGSSMGKLGAVLKGDDVARANAFGEAVSALFENSNEEEIAALIKRIVETAKVDGERINYDRDFQGEYLVDIYKVFFWVLGVNFTSFFGESGLNGIWDKVKAQLTRPAEKPNTKKHPPT